MTALHSDLVLTGPNGAGGIVATVILLRAPLAMSATHIALISEQPGLSVVQVASLARDGTGNGDGRMKAAPPAHTMLMCGEVGAGGIIGPVWGPGHPLLSMQSMSPGF